MKKYDILARGRGLGFVGAYHSDRGIIYAVILRFLTFNIHIIERIKVSPSRLGVKSD